MKIKIGLILILFFSKILFSQLSFEDIYDLESLLYNIDNSYTETTLLLNSGEYNLTPDNQTDTFSGNGLNPLKEIEVTVGLHIKGKSIEIVGTNRDSVIIETNSGYGIFIEDCPRIILKNLTITGGIRDQDGEATCAAVVVRNSSVEITNCIIKDNQGDYEKTIAGIGGIFGREGAILHFHHNEIQNNSWDGIALYRGSTAIIHDNLIYNGRGAGIGITWDARAEIYRNVIHHYWKGIGSFGTSRVSVKNNLVRDLRGWGIIATGESEMDCSNNIVLNLGNVGIAGWSEDAKIYITDNIITNCGTEEQWVAPLVGIWMNCDEGNYIIERNFLYKNKEADFAFGYKAVEKETEKFTFIEEKDLCKNNRNFTTESHSIDILQSNWGKDSDLFKDKGNPQIFDLDGSACDLGIYGGYYGKWNWNPDEKPFTGK